MKKEINKVIAGAVTLTILAILILSGPAQAFILGLTVLDKDVEKGKAVSFLVNVTIGGSEQLSIDYLLLKIRGNTNTDCKFNISGEIIQGCTGISIQRTSVPQMGYGYGYGYGYLTNGELAFNVTLDTNFYYLGQYSSEIILSVKGEETSKKGASFKIESEVLNRCSVRAEGGELVVENMPFETRNRLSFNIPLETAKNGGGSFTSQSERSRLSYKFDSPIVLENNNTHALISISGDYKINTGKKTTEKALLYLDKKNNLADVIGTKFSIKGMSVTFMQNC